MYWNVYGYITLLDFTSTSLKYTYCEHIETKSVLYFIMSVTNCYFVVIMADD